MAQLPWSDFVREVGGALEQEIDSFVAIARRTAAFHASKEQDVVRLTLEVAVGSAGLSEAARSLEETLDRLRAERDEALRGLHEAVAGQMALADRALEAERARSVAEAALKRMRTRLKKMSQAAAEAPSSEADSEARKRLGEAKAELESERIARAAAEASMVMLAREHEALGADMQAARAALDAAQDDLEATKRLNDDLQAELAELWRVLRDTRPGAPFAITLSVPSDEDSRREGIERVQAKIIDARERFKRRSHRWPIAI